MNQELDPSVQHFINALVQQRNEAQNAHAQCMAQLAVLVDAKVAREKELQEQIDTLTVKLNGD